MTGTIRAHIEKAMRKLPKDDPKVNYVATRGVPDHHCGPDKDWPTGYCTFFQGNVAGYQCMKVRGDIATKGGCDLWQKARS